MGFVAARQRAFEQGDERQRSSLSSSQGERKIEIEETTSLPSVCSFFCGSRPFADMPLVVILDDGETESSAARPPRSPQAHLRENLQKIRSRHRERLEAEIRAKRQARAMRRRLRNRRWNTKSEK